MLRICVYVIIILYFTYQAFGDISTDNETKEDGISRLIRNERRSLIAFSTIATAIGAIAGSLSIAGNVQHWSQYHVDDDGAYFMINNHFDTIELHLKGKYVIEGSTLEGPAPKIEPASKEAAGGVFDDSGPGDSAGYIQYEITNPHTTDHYCIGYLWSSEADSVHPAGAGNGANWLVALIRKQQCPFVLEGYTYAWSALLTGIKAYCKIKLPDNDCDTSFVPTTIWDQQTWFPTTDYTFYTSDSVHRIMHVKQARDASVPNEYFRIPSIDLKIGMQLHVATPDGDEDHPEITIDVGPYKEIFGSAVTRNFFVFSPNTKGGCGAYYYLGQYLNVRDCHYKCIETKGANCKYFSYRLEKGDCTWFEHGCLDQGYDVNYQLFNNVASSEYGLVENNRHCQQSTQIIGEYDDSDQCWKACKEKYNNNCENFSFGVKNKDCYMESECGIISEKNTYNLYGKYKE